MPPQEPTSAASTQQFALEFRGEDDAWYAVRLVLRGETLTVEYEDFSSDYSDVFKAGEFTTLADVESFGRRFRRVSLQLQDSQCGKVIQCMTVCASHAFNDDDVRFYDAVVEEVPPKSLFVCREMLGKKNKDENSIWGLHLFIYFPHAAPN